MRPTRRLRGLLRLAARILTAFLVATLVAAVVLWLAFQHKPRWYVPASLDEPQMQQARTEAVNVADYIGDQMVLGQPFEVAFKDETVNRWLAALPHSWPEANELLPPQISDLAVAFESGKVRVGARYEGNGWKVILSLHLAVRVTENASDIAVTLDRACGGSLPVPRTVLQRVADQILSTLKSQPHAARDRDGPTASALGSVTSGEDLLRGIRIRNRFVWANGKRPFRIEALDFRDGELRVQIKPL